MSKIIPISNYTTEPEELRNLKKLLAENTCTCKLCINHKNPFVLQYQDKEIQVKNLNIQQLHTTLPEKGSLREAFCPGCYMAMNLLGRSDLKILKDEESETISQENSCNKSIENIPVCIDKSTSDTNKACDENKPARDNVLKSLIQNQLQIENKKTGTHSDCLESKITPNHDHCLCMSNFINSIRPPFANGDIFDT